MKKHIENLSGYLIIFNMLFGLFLIRRKEKKEEELVNRIISLTPKIKNAVSEIESDSFNSKNKLFYDNNTDKPFNGLHEKFYQNGKLSSQVEYSNGVRNGMDKAWWEDGNPKHILNYKNSSKDGRFEYYNSNGVLLRAGFHKNNKKSGIWEGWYEDGNLHHSGNYVEGF